MPRTILDWAREVWTTSGEPVSVVQDGDPGEAASGAGGDLRWLLDGVAKAGKYRWKTVYGHYVVFPQDPAWDRLITGIHISNTPRLEAAEKYVESVRAQVPELVELTGPVMKGDPNAALYTEPVSLSESASVIEHLPQLLGTARDLVFVVERNEERRILYFERVQVSQRQA